LTDKRFKLKSEVDKRGNRTKAEDLKKLYQEENDDQEDGKTPSTSKSRDARGLDDDDLSSSSSDESMSESEETEVDHKWAELDTDVRRSEETSKRLAVCNVDWDRIKAVDLFVLFNSFKPESGSVISVTVYPSEFGKQRMEEEQIKGPQEIKSNNNVADDDDEEEGDDKLSYKMKEKVREYQLNRLKYFYAVVVCDSVSTAQVLYKELDGHEFESSASTLDVRFIPDDVEFDSPRDSCNSMPDLSTYTVPIFVTTALTQSKVALTWEEDDPERSKKLHGLFDDKKRLKKNMEESKMDDLSAFLASSSGSEEDVEEEDQEEEEEIELKNKPVEEKMNKYRLLLQEIEKEEKEGEDGDMEVTFQEEGEDDGDLESEQEIEEEEAPSKSKKKRKNRNEDQDKQKDNGLCLLEDDEEERNHFNYNDIVDSATSSKSKKKRLKKKGRFVEDDFVFDSQDPRFNALLSNPLFNVDPSDPHFKKTPAMNELIERKAQTRIEKKPDKKKESLDSLVKSVKLKSKAFNRT